MTDERDDTWTPKTGRFYNSERKWSLWWEAERIGFEPEVEHPHANDDWYLGEEK